VGFVVEKSDIEGRYYPIASVFPANRSDCYTIIIIIIIIHNPGLI
jgi:hypothetical protein